MQTKTLYEKLNIPLWLITISVMLPTVFSMLATSSVNVAIPYIAGQFGSTRDEANWVVTSYMIAHAMMLPITGWLEVKFTRRKLLKIISLIFAIGSVICFMAPNLNVLIIGRIVQGIGGGPFMPLSQAILMQVFPKHLQAAAMGIFGLGMMVSAIVGPAMGGILVEHLSWQWIFIINIPVVVASMVMIHCNVMNNNVSMKINKFDIVGFSALILWLLPMQTVLDKGSQYGWFDCRWICWLSGFSVCSMIFFIVWELEYKGAITDFRIFKNKNFFIGTILGSGVNMLAYMTLSTLPGFVQSLMGYNAELAGLSLTSRAVACIVFMVIVSKLCEILDNRIIAAIGYFLLATSTFTFTQLNLQVSFSYFIIPNIILGAGIMFAFIPITKLALATVEKEKLALAAGLHSLSKCVVTAFTISITNALVIALSQVHQNYLVSNLSKMNMEFLLRVGALSTKFGTFLPTMTAAKKANGIIYHSMLAQAKLLSYVDIFAIFSLLCFMFIPLCFVMSVPKD